MKTIILSLVAALVSTVAFAEGDFQYLYWMVDISSQQESNPEYAFTYATVSSASGSAFELCDESGNLSGYTSLVANDDTGFVAGYEDAGVYADITGYLGSTFLFELFNTDEERVAYAYVSRTALSNFIGNTESQISSPYVLTAVVPEPTSGLLLLLGMAGLALRRRRA